MKILHVISQKPSDTGSGIYARNIIEQLNKTGHKQAFICAVEPNEHIEIEDTIVYPVRFSSEKIPFNIVGMSDSMPYKSMKYRDLSEEQLKCFKDGFSEVIKKANEEFNPDVIICHHLYLVTALVASLIKGKKVFGICHSTDLRQLRSHEMEKEFIIDNIRKLHGILALHDSCKEQIKELFNISDEKIHVTGIGYDDNIFFNKNLNKGDTIEIVFTGKVCYAKGLEAMYNAFNLLVKEYPNIRLNIVGTGSGSEYENIINMYEKSKGEVKFWGRLNHDELSELYSRSHIFILPSFYEGLPLVIVEALASGLYVVASDISGVKSWLGEEINSSGKIEFVSLPTMENIDKPIKEELPMYEKALCKALKNMVGKIKNKNEDNIDVSNLSWNGLSKRILKIIE